MGGLLFKPKKDIGHVIVEAFYIVGTVEERSAKCEELINANPALTCRITEEHHDCSATALQLSNVYCPPGGVYRSIKSLAELHHAEGGKSVFLISSPAREFRM